MWRRGKKSPAAATEATAEACISWGSASQEERACARGSSARSGFALVWWIAERSAFDARNLLIAWRRWLRAVQRLMCEPVSIGLLTSALITSMVGTGSTALLGAGLVGIATGVASHQVLQDMAARGPAMLDPFRRDENDKSSKGGQPTAAERVARNERDRRPLPPAAAPAVASLQANGGGISGTSPLGGESSGTSPLISN